MIDVVLEIAPGDVTDETDNIAWYDGMMTLVGSGQAACIGHWLEVRSIVRILKPLRMI